MSSLDQVSVYLQRVAKMYRRGETTVRALASVNLEIRRGEFVCVMGRSGSGKSTLLHVMGGLDTFDAGEVIIADHALSKMSDDEVTLLRRRRLGFVFQSFNLLPTLTAEENVALPLLLDRCRVSEVRMKVQRILERLGLGHRRSHRPDELSGGEQQRVAIARALVIEPVVLLADEPTGNLDSATGEMILDLLKEMSRNGQTIVMVTHDNRAASYGDRIVTLRDGRIMPEDWDRTGFGADNKVSSVIR
jgi:putative ABC transport system ATP-binding protein